MQFEFFTLFVLHFPDPLSVFENPTQSAPGGEKDDRTTPKKQIQMTWNSAWAQKELAKNSFCNMTFHGIYCSLHPSDFRRRESQPFFIFLNNSLVKKTLTCKTLLSPARLHRHTPITVLCQSIVSSTSPQSSLKALFLSRGSWVTLRLLRYVLAWKHDHTLGISALCHPLSQAKLSP